MNILDAAKSITSGERQDDYGDPEDSFECIAAYWTIHLQAVEFPLKPSDVAKMMILLKLAREENRHKVDNLVDIAGYARALSLIEGDEIDENVTSSDSDVDWGGRIIRKVTRENTPS